MRFRVYKKKTIENRIVIERLLLFFFLKRKTRNFLVSNTFKYKKKIFFLKKKFSFISQILFKVASNRDYIEYNKLDEEKIIIQEENVRNHFNILIIFFKLVFKTPKIN